MLRFFPFPSLPRWIMTIALMDHDHTNKNDYRKLSISFLSPPSLPPSTCMCCHILVVLVCLYHVCLCPKAVLCALRVPLSERRLAVVDAAFSALLDLHAAAASGTGNHINNRSNEHVDTFRGASANAVKAGESGEHGRGDGGDGVKVGAGIVSLDVALRRFNPKGQPEVSAGRLTADEVGAFYFYVCMRMCVLLLLSPVLFLFFILLDLLDSVHSQL